jgi:hypothetical protein
VLLAPVALLDADTALMVSRLLGALILVAVSAWWIEAGEERAPAWPWPLALSLPAVATVFLGQLPTAIGLGAFTVAVAAQRRQRWWLVGVAVAVGLIRPANALPVIAMLVTLGWPRPRVLLTAAVIAALVLAPLTLIAFANDPGWLSQYLRSLGDYPFGLPSMLGRAFGPVGWLVPQAIVAAAAAFWTRRRAGGAAGIDRAAAVVAATVLVAPLSAVYAAVYGLPALLRLARRTATAAISPLAFAAPWLTALSPPDGPLPFHVLAPTAAAALVIAAIPMLLRSP